MFAAWAPVTKPTEAVAGMPSSSLSQPPATSSAAAAAGDVTRVERHWSQPAASMSAAVAGRQRAADDEAEEARAGGRDQAGLDGCDQVGEDRLRREAVIRQRQVEGGADVVQRPAGDDRPVGERGR